MSAYTKQIISRLWSFRDDAFSDQDELFDQPTRKGNRPPVFVKNAAAHNVLVAPGLTPAQRSCVLSSLPSEKRHRWFRSMKSSQALAQSVFGNLRALDRLSLLHGIRSDSNDYPFTGATEAELEHSVGHLGEISPRTTNVDVLLKGRRKVAVECKFSEHNIGCCSRPSLTPGEPDHCDGRYVLQYARTTRCALTEVGVLYWSFINRILRWDSASDLIPCPLRRSYQLVRNVLAACVAEDGSVQVDEGIAVLLVDERNPAFQPGGIGRAAYDAVKASLRHPNTLQMCTWQNVMGAIQRDPALVDLAARIEQKYGFVGHNPKEPSNG